MSAPVPTYDRRKTRPEGSPTFHVKYRCFRFTIEAMVEFNSPDSYRSFEQAVKRARRYVHDSEVRDFISTVVETSARRKVSIKKGAVLWRAQRGYIWRKENEGTDEEFEVPDAYDPKRMVPDADFVGDGRVIPRGIPALYLASTKEAAMSEVRPWVGSYISLAQFRIMRDVTVVDCSRDTRIFPNWLLAEVQVHLPAERKEEIAWGEINHALSRPITPDDPPTEYVPTQILAEAFRAHGYDGIAYRSLLGAGHNVALFDCVAAELINCGLYETTAVQFTFDQCSNPYFITKRYEQLKSTAADAPERLEHKP